MHTVDDGGCDGQQNLAQCELNVAKDSLFSTYRCIVSLSTATSTWSALIFKILTRCGQAYTLLVNSVLRTQCVDQVEVRCPRLMQFPDAGKYWDRCASGAVVSPLRKVLLTGLGLHPA